MKVKKLSFVITGHGPLMFGQRVFEAKRPDETHEQLEERTWIKRCCTDHDGHLSIKSTAVHRSLIAAGKWLSMKLEGKKTYTKRLEAGLIPLAAYFKICNGRKECLVPEDCRKETLSVPSNGMRGGTQRVIKHFPMLNPGWKVLCEFVVTDEALTLDVLEKHAATAGLHDGMGSMRAANAGPNGRYLCSDFKLQDYDL